MRRVDLLPVGAARRPPVVAGAATVWDMSLGDVRAKLDRRMRRVVRHALRVVPARAERVVRVTTSAELVRVLRRSRWVSARHPLHVLLAPGAYRLSSWVPDGVILDGPEARLWWDEDGDVLNASGRDVTLRGLTVEHVGPGLGYAVHADGPGRGARLTLTDVTLRGATKAALGVGLFGGQAVHATGSRFEGAGDADGVYAHNWYSQPSPCRIEMDGCVYMAEMGAPARWTDLGSGQPDVAHFG